MKIPLAIVILGVNSLCQASVESELTKIYNSFGSSTHETPAGAYKGQSSGYYTGGSLYVRNYQSNLQPMSIQMPKFSAGCGGIDLFKGGLSFVNHEQLKQTLNNILSNSSSLAFAIAMKTYSPMIFDQVQALQNMANDINQFNMNSCQTAAQGLGMVWPKTQASQELLCQAGSVQGGLSSSFLESKMDCRNNPSRVVPGKNDSEAIQPPQNVNLAWKSITSNAFLNSNRDVAQLIMSLSGTLVFSDPENKGTQIPTIYPSLATNQDILNALMKGGEARVYRCQDPAKGCLELKTDGVIKISKSNSLQGLVEQAMQEMVEAIHNGTSLSEKNKQLLSATTLPIYKMINVQTAYAPATHVFDLQNNAELVATDLLYHFLSTKIEEVEQTARVFDLGDAAKPFFDGIQNARQRVNEQRLVASDNISRTLTLIEQYQKIEQDLAGRYASEFVNVPEWSKGAGR